MFIFRFINDVKVYLSTDGALVKKNENNVTQLFIDTKKFSISQPITVTAENENGIDQAKAYLTVNDPSLKQPEVFEVKQEEVTQLFTESSKKIELVTESMLTIDEIQVNTLGDKKLLELKKPLTDQTVERGSKICFETQIINATQVQWSLDGRPVSPTNSPKGVHFFNENYDFSLVIDSTQQAGIVKCFARGEHNSVETKADYVVVNRPVPVFILIIYLIKQKFFRFLL